MKKNILAQFLPSNQFLITPLLIAINILVFVIMIASGVNLMEPSSESLLAWGANFRPSTLSGEPWRLFTACFLHIGVIHLIFNMYALLNIGILLEPILGKGKFLIAYIFTGLFSSVASLWWHDDLIVSAGASGAIFGMYGVFLGMLTTNLIPKVERKAFLTSIGIFIVYNLVYGLKGGVDNAAHIGGLISGCMIGYALYPILRNPQKKSQGIAIFIVGLAIIAAGCLVLYFKTPNDIGKYYAKMEEFTRLETEALKFYELPDDTPTDDLLYDLKYHGIANWEKCQDILEESSKLDLPDNIEANNIQLQKYVSIRMQTYKIIYQSIEEDTDKYRPKIDSMDMEIGKILEELNKPS